LSADELVQPVEIGKAMIVIGVPVFDSTRKVVTLEARHITNDDVFFCNLTSRLK